MNEDEIPTLCARDYKGPVKVAIPVLTQDRAEKRQNGRRMKENNDPAFTLTAQDRHGVAVSVPDKEVGGVVTIPIREAVKKGYTEARQGDSINFSHLYSDTRRGRGERQCANTLDTKCEQGVIETFSGDPAGHYVELEDGTQVYAVWYEKYQCYIAIRKLTPRECFRLQGWDDEYFERAEFVCSDSQLYKQAGNGVSVPVVEAIGRKISEADPS